MPIGSTPLRGYTKALAVGGAGLVLACCPALAQADVWGTTFEAPSYTPGDIDGQNDWTKAGGYDSNVATVSSFANAAGFGFGSKALQISNKTTATEYTGQTYTPRLVDEAGEADAMSAGLTGGIRQPHFYARFRIGTTKSTQQNNLQLRVSPDRGEGGRMTYLRFEDQSDGVHVIFKDLPNGAVTGPPGSQHVNFVDTDIGTISRTESHLIEYSIDLNDGADNDVVRVYIDGVLKATGHTWEEYYRNDSEQSGNGNEVPTISSLGFVESGPADVTNAGQGFLIDDVRIESGGNSLFTGATGPQGQQGPQGPQGQQGLAGSTTSSSQGVVAKGHRVSLGKARFKSGRFKVAVKCPKGAGRCAGRLFLLRGGKAIGSATFSIAAGKAKTLTVRPTSVQRLHRKLKLLAVAYSRDDAGAYAETHRKQAVRT